MSEKPNRRLVVVSNRLPFNLVEKKGKVTLKASDGGLVSALNSYFENKQVQDVFSEIVWIGSAEFPQKRWEKLGEQKSSEPRTYNIQPIFVDPKVYNKYYNGFCNATLWPLFHYFPSFTVFDEEYFRCYEEINNQFAEQVTSLLQPGDVLWIHDYQLFLLPGLVREKVPDATIGFFLHIPFPSYELFRMLHKPWKEKIIQGMLGADLIGFHIHEYVQHFLKTVSMVSGHNHQYRLITFTDRVVKADLFPIGIDYNKFHGTARNEQVLQVKESLLKNFGDKKIIFSVDRLDYTKGITHRLAGFERFLERFPEWREKIVFILVVVPSRQIISKYNERRKLIEEQVGRLNGKYSTLEWQPVIYRYSTLDFDELCALYQGADIALITPLRDGMNLVAKEYVASRTTQRGVLILSELAGAASELGEALLVNPMDADEIATALENAVNMTAEEQQARMHLMQERLMNYNVVSWVNDFLNQLNEVKAQQEFQKIKFVTRKVQDRLISDFQSAANRNLFLDYDGTLVPFARNPREARPDRNLMQLLASLTSEPKTNVAIISGRNSKILNEWFQHLPITIVAEHGASVRRNGNEWVDEKEDDQKWKELIQPTLESFVHRCPGAFIEEKNHTLAWHYRTVESELGFLRSRELLDNLYHLASNSQLQIIDGNKVIEVRIAGIDKGTIAKKLMSESGSDFVLAIGDDTTDEDMFRALSDNAVTIKVGLGQTLAQYSVPTQQDVIRLLNQFIKKN